MNRKWGARLGEVLVGINLVCKVIDIVYLVIPLLMIIGPLYFKADPVVHWGDFYLGSLALNILMYGLDIFIFWKLFHLLKVLPNFSQKAAQIWSNVRIIRNSLFAFGILGLVFSRFTVSTEVILNSWQQIILNSNSTKDFENVMEVLNSIFTYLNFSLNFSQLFIFQFNSATAVLLALLLTVMSQIFVKNRQLQEELETVV